MLLLSEQLQTPFHIGRLFVIVLCMCFYAVEYSHCQFVINPGSSRRSEQLVPCHVPTGNASFCVPLTRCNQIFALIRNLQKPLPGDVAKYIKDSFFCPKISPRDPNTVCCPFDSIIDPKPTNRPIIRNRDEDCVSQNGELGSCSVYLRCPPLLQLLSNLRRPFPAEVPRLMQQSLLCGRQNVDGVNLPKVCCPKEAVADESSTTEKSTDTPKPITDQERFATHPNRKSLTDECPPIDVDSRIVGGKEAPIGAYPWLALLGFSLRNSGTNIQWKCGGAIIGDKYILTAAHCVTNLPGAFQLSKVRVGEHQISNVGLDCNAFDTDDCNAGHQDFDIEKLIIHPSYNSPEVFRNDIALIRIKGKINLNKYVQSICLPYDDDINEDYLAGANKDINKAPFVAGWGATDSRGRNTADTLQHLKVSIFDGDKCRDVYKERGGKLSPESQLCAGGEAGRDSCVGDSGSALMTTKPKAGNAILSEWKIIGIVSFGPRICGTDGVPGVYSKVRHYIDWILDSVVS